MLEQPETISPPENAPPIPPEAPHQHLEDVPDDERHEVHYVHLTTKAGKEEVHVMRVGGAAGGGMTAEQMAEHITRTNHFLGRAKKIVVKRGGRHAVKGSLFTLVQNPKVAKIEMPVSAEVEPHPTPTTATPVLAPKPTNTASEEASSPEKVLSNSELQL